MTSKPLDVQWGYATTTVGLPLRDNGVLRLNKDQRGKVKRRKTDNNRLAVSESGERTLVAAIVRTSNGEQPGQSRKHRGEGKRKGGGVNQRKKGS